MEEEMRVEQLSEPGWIRVTLVVRNKQPSFHVTGELASKEIAKMALGIANAVLRQLGATELAAQITKVASHVGIVADTN